MDIDKETLLNMMQIFCSDKYAVKSEKFSSIPKAAYKRTLSKCPSLTKPFLKW